MFKERAITIDDIEDFSYDRRGPGPDLLDYRYMDLEMSRWARTDMSCLSFFAMVLGGFGCAIVMYVYVAVIRGF
ncbi:MAG TPA: hypothetical protein VGE45_18895 [Chloroflexia bacterium]|jgi:hypothetical protein